MNQTRELNKALRDFGEYKVDKDLSKQDECDINKKAAEILVESGYAEISDTIESGSITIHVKFGRFKDYRWQLCKPFSDTLEGRRQADAIEDWLIENELQLWLTARNKNNLKQHNHQWRLNRIKWCLKELSK